MSPEQWWTQKRLMLLLVAWSLMTLLRWDLIRCSWKEWQAAALESRRQWNLGLGRRRGRSQFRGRKTRCRPKRPFGPNDGWQCWRWSQNFCCSCLFVQTIFLVCCSSLRQTLQMNVVAIDLCLWQLQSSLFLLSETICCPTHFSCLKDKLVALKKSEVWSWSTRLHLRCCTSGAIRSWCWGKILCHTPRPTCWNPTRFYVPGFVQQRLSRPSYQTARYNNNNTIYRFRGILFGPLGQDGNQAACHSVPLRKSPLVHRILIRSLSNWSRSRTARKVKVKYWHCPKTT